MKRNDADTAAFPLRLIVTLLVLLHGVAAWIAPATLWGISHLSTWPRFLAVGWTLGLAAACWMAPRLVRFLPALRQPGRLGALGIALATGPVFWLLRERSHLFGDGQLLIRDGGFSETVTRAPLLVHATARWVAVAHAEFSQSPETSLALASVMAGCVGVYALLRTSAHLASSASEFWLVTVLMAGAGSLQLFFGHVEYYAVVAAALLVMLALVTRVLDDFSSRRDTISMRLRGGAVWVGFALLVPLHLSALALVPAYGFLAWRMFRERRRQALGGGILVGAVVAWWISRTAGDAAGVLGASLRAGMQRYTAPYFETESSLHAFGLFAPGHFLALLNDILLVAPLAWLGLLGLRAAGSAGAESDRWRFLGVATLGFLALRFVFAPELGPYRDWDILAPYGFVLLAWAATALLRTRVDRRVALCVVALGALAHTVPWVLLHVKPDATLRHIETVLTSTSQWSPSARAYMNETIAIYHRDHGAEELSLSFYEAATRADSTEARYNVGLGNRYVQRGEFAAAAWQYASALDKQPEFAPAHNNLAFALASVPTDLDRAREHAHAALRLAPRNADYWLTLARVEIAAKRPEAARRALREALQLRRPFPVAEKLLRSLAD